MYIEEARWLAKGARLKISHEAIVRCIYPNRKSDFAAFFGLSRDGRSIRLIPEGLVTIYNYHPSFWNVGNV